MPLPAQYSLANFYASVRFANPTLAELMRKDIFLVAMYALSDLSEDNMVGREAANRLRRLSFDLPEIHQRVLANTLQDLGF